jgi:hypothetical protein
MMQDYRKDFGTIRAALEDFASGTEPCLSDGVTAFPESESW